VPLQRSSARPLLTPREIPALRADLEDVSGVFNPGAVLWQGRELLLLRVQTRGRTTLLLPAERHADGRVEVLGGPITIAGLDRISPAPAHVYDPRLSVIEGAIYGVLACDFSEGCRLLTVRSENFEHWEMVSLDPGGDRRNGVLFPERIAGRFMRLERPNQQERAGAPSTGDTIVLSESKDLLQWKTVAIVLRGRPQMWDELIGSGPPPVKTREGWLHIYHGVATHFASVNIYQAGIVLFDLEDPSRLLARGAFNILEPRESWELTGQVPNVVFPSGMIVEETDAEGFAEAGSAVRIYYGAADTVVGMATTTIAQLVEDARFIP